MAEKLGFFAKVRQIIARMIATFMANGLATVGAVLSRNRHTRRNISWNTWWC